MVPLKSTGYHIICTPPDDGTEGDAIPNSNGCRQERKGKAAVDGESAKEKRRQQWNFFSSTLLTSPGQSKGTKRVDSSHQITTVVLFFLRGGLPPHWIAGTVVLRAEKGWPQRSTAVLTAAAQPGERIPEVARVQVQIPAAARP